MKTPLQFNPLITTANDWRGYFKYFRSELTKSQIQHNIKVIEINKTFTIYISLKDTDGFDFDYVISNDSHDLAHVLNNEIRETLIYYIVSKQLTIDSIYEDKLKFNKVRYYDTSIAKALRKLHQQQLMEYQF